MEDFIFINTCKSERDLNDYIGRYNIFMLNRDGHVEFAHSDREFCSLGGSLVVWPKSRPCDSIDYQDELNADVVLVSDYFLDLYKPETVWDLSGTDYFRECPVMLLKEIFPFEWSCLENDFHQIRDRIDTLEAYQGEDIMGSLLRVLINDIWMVIARLSISDETDKLPSGRFAEFLLLIQKYCRTHRDVAWYAEELGITPKYLTEISNYATGRPAGDWIEERAARVLRRELSAENLSLTDLAAEMNFSSLPAFTRYVKRVLGCSPSKFHRELKKKYSDI